MDNVHLIPPKIDVFGTGITLPGRADPNQAVTGPCWPQLCAVFVRSGIKLSDPHSNRSLETEGKFKYLARRLRSENYETTVAVKTVTFWDVMPCDLVTLRPRFEETKCLGDTEAFLPWRWKSEFLQNTDQLLPDGITTDNYISEISLRNSCHNSFRKSCLHKLSLIKHNTVKVSEGAQV
jgi:hypothetical protein